MGGRQPEPGADPADTAEPGPGHSTANPTGRKASTITKSNREPGSEPRGHQAAFAVARLPMALVDEAGLVLEANPALGALLGADPAGLACRPAADLVGLGGDERLHAEYAEVLDGRRRELRCTRPVRHSQGRIVRAEVTVARLPGRDGALLSVEDLGERYELRQELRYLRMHDPVTGLPNREMFFERLTLALDQGSGRSSRTGRIGLCYVDLDGFKAVNDTLGHRMGDQLLTAVGERLTACAGYHLVARLGGDEFAVLVEDSTGTGQATTLAEAILGALQRPFDLSGQRIVVSASIGVVEREAGGTSATCLMQNADTTLYWAKTDGKARWTLFDPERNAHRMTRQALSSTLRQAVERSEFALEYQPLVELGSGSLRGVEALVRWHHPQFGTLGPNRFISLAEENGAIVQLGRWVLQEACRQARQWQKDHPDDPLFVSVNVAVRQVWDSDLVADVARILDDTGLPPALLQLELTESAVMGSTGQPLQALHELHEMGVGIAIDDFGTGYSNLAYLSRLPVSALKLDGSFVHGFQCDRHQNPADETIVEALVQLAHRLGLTVTAECVESAQQAERLRLIGCDTGQGWLYSRPVPADGIAALRSR